MLRPGHDGPATRWWIFGWASVSFGLGRAAAADDPAITVPPRPAILFNRWQEDWSVLADPAIPKEPSDNLKYIPFSTEDPWTYLSLGGGLRERFEANGAANFGVGSNRNADNLISRLEAHADLWLGPTLQVFTQLVSAFSPGKTHLTPVDQERLDLEQGFVTVSEGVGGGTVRLRIGRQQIGFDLQRFVGVRDGPNIRQSYDAVWANCERGAWRLIGFYSLPVQNRDLRAFDAFSSAHLTYRGGAVGAPFRIGRDFGVLLRLYPARGSLYRRYWR